MHIEKTYRQLWIVDANGDRHNLCEVLEPLLTVHVATNPDPEPVQVKGSHDGTRVSIQDQRTEGDQQEPEETGAESGQEADSQGSPSGGKSDAGGSPKASPRRKNKATKKTGKGKVAKS